jgi:hypothetical protein
MGKMKTEVGTAIACDALEGWVRAKALIIVVQMVSNCVVTSMARGEVRVHYALCGLGSLLQTAWSAQAWV